MTGLELIAAYSYNAPAKTNTPIKNQNIMDFKDKLSSSSSKQNPDLSEDSTQNEDDMKSANLLDIGMLFQNVVNTAELSKFNLVPNQEISQETIGSDMQASETKNNVFASVGLLDTPTNIMDAININQPTREFNINFKNIVQEFNTDSISNEQYNIKNVIDGSDKSITDLKLEHFFVDKESMRYQQDTKMGDSFTNGDTDKIYHNKLDSTQVVTKVSAEDTSSEGLENQVLYSNTNKVSDGMLEVKVSNAETLDLGKADFPNQMADKIIARSIDGNQTFELQLKPEALGKVTIKLVFEEGRATVEMFCSDIKAKNILLGHTEQIKSIIQNNTGDLTTITCTAQEDYLMQDHNNTDANGRGNQQNKQQTPFENSEDFLKSLMLSMDIDQEGE